MSERRADYGVGDGWPILPVLRNRTPLVEIELWDEPVPKARPRVVANGKRTYTPARTLAAEHAIAWETLRKRPGLQPSEGPFWLEADFTCKRKSSDVDNLLKVVLDGLNGVVWLDDKQVTDVHARVRRTHGIWVPSTRLVIGVIEEVSG